MRFVPEPITQHRLQRFHRWAMLWLTWFAAFLDAASGFAPLSPQAQRAAHNWLNRIERVIVSIVMLRAAPRVRTIRMRRHGAAPNRSNVSLRRAVMGSSMRRALRPKDLRHRIAALTQNLDALIARVLKRLPCGLTRRSPIVTRPEARTALACIAPFADARAADTS